MADVSLFILLAFLMAYCHLSKVCACLFKLLKSSAVMPHWSVVGGWLNNSNKFVQTNNIDAFFWKKFLNMFFCSQKHRSQKICRDVTLRKRKILPWPAWLYPRMCHTSEEKGFSPAGLEIAALKKVTTSLLFPTIQDGRKDLHNC